MVGKNKSLPSLSAGRLVCGSHSQFVKAQLLTVKTTRGVDSAIEGINGEGLVMVIEVWDKTIANATT